MDDYFNTDICSETDTTDAFSLLLLCKLFDIYLAPKDLFINFYPLLEVYIPIFDDCLLT